MRRARVLHSGAACGSLDGHMHMYGDVLRANFAVSTADLLPRTDNLDLKAYEGNCLGCEPCTADCNADAVIGGAGGDDPDGDGEDAVDPLYLMPCQLGDPVGDLEKNGDCIGKEVTMVKCLW